MNRAANVERMFRSQLLTWTYSNPADTKVAFPKDHTGNRVKYSAAVGIYFHCPAIGWPTYISIYGGHAHGAQPSATCELVLEARNYYSHVS
jgi:hypothetical protein